MTARLLRQRIPGLKKKHALALKEVIHRLFPRPNSYAREDKIRQLIFNLVHNPSLIGTVDAATLVSYTDEDFRRAPGFVHVKMAIKSSREVLKELLSVDTLDEEKLAQHAPITICRKCGGEEVSFYGRQQRSADEGITIFYECLNQRCNYKWHVST